MILDLHRQGLSASGVGNRQADLHRPQDGAQIYRARSLRTFES